MNHIPVSLTVTLLVILFIILCLVFPALPAILITLFIVGAIGWAIADSLRKDKDEDDESP